MMRMCLVVVQLQGLCALPPTRVLAGYLKPWVTSPFAASDGSGVSPETIACTNQSFYEEGTSVNLERPLAANARLGGHFVQGHVDAVTRQRFQRQEGDFVRLRFELPAGLARYLVGKGSIAINGVSLTIADLDEDWFDVQLVPHTLEHTNLISDKRAEAMNVEVDILGKYVARMLEGHLQVPAVESIVAIAGDEK